MTKIEVNIKVPGINKVYRVRFPGGMMVSTGIHLIIQMILEKYPEVACEEKELYLYRAEIDAEVNPQYTFQESGIKEGELLILG